MKNFLKKEIKKTLPFLVFALFLFGASFAFGFLAARLFPSFSLKGLTVLRGAASLPKEIATRGEELIFMAAYNLLVLVFLFLTSFAFGIGSLTLIFLRGVVAGVSFSYALGAPLSFSLIFPYPVFETLAFILPASFFLRLGFEAFKKVLGMKIFLKKEAKRGIKALFLFFGLLVFVNLLEIFVLPKILF